MEDLTKYFGRGPVDFDDPEQVKPYEMDAFRADPIAMIRLGYLSIKNKNGELIRFIPNSSQEKILCAIQERRLKGIPLRLFVLKSRQMGVSTLAQAILYVFASQRAHMNGLVVADDLDGASYIFKMNELFYDQMSVNHPHLTPDIKRADEKRLEFYRKFSQIMIETSKNPRAGRKYTIQMAHLSEVAFYPAFTELMQSLRPSIPDEPETMILMETTANGINDVSKFWFRIKALAEKNETEWVPIFLSWKEHAEYTREFPNLSIQDKFVDSMSVEEKTIMKTYELTLEQMNWRRHMIEDYFGSDKEKFEVEYPLTDREAFKSTSRRVFPDRLVDPQRIHIQVPKHVGEMERVDRRAAFVPDKDGFLKIYQESQPEERYVIGADTCESALTHDEACAQVIKRSTWTQVAHMHGHINPEDFALKLSALGAYYNNALLCPERNGPGLVTVTRLADMHYPNLCKIQRSTVSDSGQWIETEEYGFHTNVKTKPLIIDQLASALRNLLIVLHDAKTLEELETYVVKQVNKEGYVEMGAEEGFRDDCVMALAVAVHYAHQIPAQRFGSIPEQTFSPNTKTGY